MFGLQGAKGAKFRPLACFWAILEPETQEYIIISAMSSFLWGRWGQQCADFGFGELATLHTVADPDKGAVDNEVITFGELDVRCIQYAALNTPNSTE
jgi:hypothetical protein